MKKIAIVVSKFNEAVTGRLQASCLKKLKEAGYEEALLDTFLVPGAVEIPLIAKIKAASGDYAAVICLGAVIKGETDHYDVVCQQVGQGVMQVMLETQLPIIFGVLTTQNSSQAFARSGGEHSDKGVEAAETALEMIELCGV